MKLLTSTVFLVLLHGVSLLGGAYAESESAARREGAPSVIGIMSPQSATGPSLAISPDDLSEALCESSLVRSGASRLIGGPVQENREKAAAASPLTYVTKDAPPLLIVHGQRDKLVSVHQSQMLFDALKAAGAPVTLMIRPWVGHGIHDPTTTSAQNQFFDKYLKPQPK